MLTETLAPMGPRLPPVLEAEGYEWGQRFLSGRLGVSMVRHIASSRVFVLKMATEQKPLDPDQIRLLDLGASMEPSQRHLPAIERVGETWFLMEYLGNKTLSQIIDTHPETAIGRTLALSQWYQHLLKGYHHLYGRRAPSAAEIEWPFKRIFDWGKPIVQENIISSKKLADIEANWRKLAQKYGPSLYKHVHGNIHPDHVVANDKQVYILDPVDWIRPCPFDGATYDWLRALDWIILKSTKPAAMFQLVLKTMREKLPTIDHEDLKTFMALRGLGCIGGDILQQRDPPNDTTTVSAERAQVLLQLVNGDYEL